MTHSIPPGFYDDDQGRKQYWDGTAWTGVYAAEPDAQQRAPSGASGFRPLGVTLVAFLIVGSIVAGVLLFTFFGEGR